MAAQYPTIMLLPGRHRRIKAGHPWAYSNEIAMTAAAKALPPGDPVRLVAGSGEAMGVAGFNPHSLVAARILDRDPEARIDADFLAARLRRALALRARLYAAPFYRLVHAEADGLPGLVVDRFGDTLAIQLNAAVMDRLREPLLDALEGVLSLAAAVLRNDSPVRRLEGLESGIEVVRGTLEGPVEVQEDDVRFLADLAGGQKTGWFFDQRDNRRFMRRLCRDATVLDLYCHTGGFALQAAAGGASDVLAVDGSASALELAESAAGLNGVADRCRFVKAEAFAEMERLAGAATRFDVVIADPPAFIKSKKDLKAGARGYRKMARLAARLVAPGGYLFVASCSHNLPAEMFDEQIRKGLADASRTGRILRQAGAAPDHPLDPWLPESGYLKARVLQLD